MLTDTYRRAHRVSQLQTLAYARDAHRKDDRKADMVMHGGGILEMKTTLRCL